MSQQLAYLNDPLTLDFEATIQRKTGQPSGPVEVILDRTFFYPTGGGQYHDTGTLNQARVLDVFKDEQGNVVHRLERDVDGPQVIGRIDPARRLGHMQHHSAQHIVSRALELELGLDTLSAHISAETPSTVDVPEADLSTDDLNRVEQCANQIVFENRPIKTYTVPQADLHTVPLRRPPKVTGQIRVVEVTNFDYSACGGTHCPHTGMIGLIKIVKTERKNKKLRLHFVAGGQALAMFQQFQHVATQASLQLSTSLEETPALLAQQLEQLRQAHKEMQSLRAELLTVEAERLARQAADHGDYRLVTALVQGRSGGELRQLANELAPHPDLVALLAAVEAGKLSLVVRCGPASGVNARALLQWQLGKIGGKGGGDARLAQGGGSASGPDLANFFAGVREQIDRLRAG